MVGPKPRALVLEDDRVNRAIFAEILRRGGYDVVEVPGVSGRSPERGYERADLLVVEALLEGGSGVDAAAELLRLQPGLKIILTSRDPVDTWPEPVQAALRKLPRNSYVFLPKPECVLEMRNVADGLRQGTYRERPMRSLWAAFLEGEAGAPQRAG